MKTNEAPEKIYLDSYGSGFSHGFHTNKLYDNDIEYISTDVFIEKACEFIEQNITDYIDVTHYGGDENIILQKEFIEFFKNNFERL